MQDSFQVNGQASPGRHESTPRRRVRRLAGLLGAMCVASVASAHHSSTTFYDYDNFIEFEGEVSRVLWRNPHVQFSIMRTMEDGTREEWLADSASVNSLQRGGFDRQLVSPGDVVRVYGPVSRQGLKAIRAVNLMLPGGEEYLMMAGQGVGFRWSEDALQVRGGRLPVPEAVDGAAEPEGIFRVWSPGTDIRTLERAAMRPLALTESALARRDAWDPLVDDPGLTCTQQGMPGIMMNPFPIEFIERDGVILLRTEEWDVERTIHVDPSTEPQAEFSHLGFSAGRWEGNTLVVETNRISWPYYDDRGTPQSPDVHIVERFTLSGDATRLDYVQTATDPTNFREPLVDEFFWVWVPGEEVKPYECALWDSSDPSGNGQ